MPKPEESAMGHVRPRGGVSGGCRTRGGRTSEENDGCDDTDAKAYTAREG